MYRSWPDARNAPADVPVPDLTPGFRHHLQRVRCYSFGLHLEPAREAVPHRRPSGKRNAACPEDQRQRDGRGQDYNRRSPRHSPFLGSVDPRRSCANWGVIVRSSCHLLPIFPIRSGGDRWCLPVVCTNFRRGYQLIWHADAQAGAGPQKRRGCRQVPATAPIFSASCYAPYGAPRVMDIQRLSRSRCNP